jgi:hypothetical protein
VPLCSRVATVGLEKFKKLNGICGHSSFKYIQDAMWHYLLKHAKPVGFDRRHNLKKVRVREGSVGYFLTRGSYRQRHFNSTVLASRWER